MWVDLQRGAVCCDRIEGGEELRLRLGEECRTTPTEMTRKRNLVVIHVLAQSRNPRDDNRTTSAAEAVDHAARTALQHDCVRGPHVSEQFLVRHEIASSRSDRGPGGSTLDGHYRARVVGCHPVLDPVHEAIERVVVRAD